MRLSVRRVLLMVVAAVVLGVECLPPLAAQEIRLNPLLAGQLEYTQTQLVAGRVRVTTNDPTRPMDTNSTDGERQERLVLSAAGGKVTLNYRLTTPKAHFTIDVVQADQFTMNWQPEAKDQPELMSFVQPATGPVTLTLGPDDARREYQGATVWHVLLAAPKPVADRLTQQLQTLRPQWDLGTQLATVEASLARAGRRPATIDRATTLELIHQLGSPRYAERERAERSLRSLGSELAPIVRNLHPGDLDPEQQFRLRGIMATAAGANDEDDPRQVAAWLAGDPWVWWHLLDRDDADLRALAKEQLSRLLEREIAFDVNAEPAVRATQRESLSEQLPVNAKF